jgi:hypothetical protein
MALGRAGKPRRRKSLHNKRVPHRPVAELRAEPDFEGGRLISAAVVDRLAALRGSNTQREAAAGTVRINRADEKRATLKARRVCVTAVVEGREAKGNVTEIRARANAV